MLISKIAYFVLTVQSVKWTSEMYKLELYKTIDFDERQYFLSCLKLLSAKMHEKVWTKYVFVLF